MSFQKRVTKQEKIDIDLKGEAILSEFAAKLTQGVAANDESNLTLVQKHFTWTKTFMNNSKLAYLNMVKGYVSDYKTKTALNSSCEGLAEYVNESALFFMGRIK